MIESFSSSPIPVKDSDSFMEEIDIFLITDDSIPPGIDSNGYDSEEDNLFLKYEPDPGELTRVVMEDIYGEPRVHMPNVLPTHPTICQDLDFTISTDFSGSDLVVSFPFGNRNKTFDLGISIKVQSKRFLSLNKCSISFISDPLSPVLETLLLFSSEIEDKVFNPGILVLKEEKSPHLLSHQGFKVFKIIHNFLNESPMMIYGADMPILDDSPDYEDSHARGSPRRRTLRYQDITLDSTHFDTDHDMFGVHDLDGDEVFVTEESMDNATTIASTILVSAAKDLFDVDMTLAQALAELKNAKPKAVTTAATTTTTAVPRPKPKGLVIQEQEQASTPITSSKDKGKGIMVEEPLKMMKKDQVLFDEQEAIRLQAQFDEEARIAREKEEANAALIAQWNDIQDKVETDYELAQRLQAEEQEELIIEEKMEAQRIKEQKEGSKKAEAEVIESSSKRIGEELKSDKSKKEKLDEKVEAEVDDAKEAKELKQCLEDLEVLWRIVKARFKKTEPVNYMDTFLHLNLKTLFEHHVEDSIWKNQQGLVEVLNWKLFYSCGVHCVTVQFIV
ncbi:hypothetical protein Tco_0726556 [Tanacetum coccineum]|uniref:Uncharacterized protein n=1 Tax=Tanacetum coccineum TaxID=301880 RepID=A0ABQ4YI78_9ASTR